MNSYNFQSWDQFYTIEDPEQSPIYSYQNRTYFESNNTQIPFSSQNSLFIVRCLFSECNVSSGYGGAIQYSTIYGKLLVEFSTFVRCSATEENAGSIYSVYCNSVINCVCSYKSSAKGNGQFLYTYLDDGEKKNFVIQSSLSHDRTYTEGSSPIRLDYGIKICDQTNISNYIVKFYSILYFQSGEFQGTLSFCSFNSNEATDSVCIAFDSGTTYEISMCNLINNKHNNQSQGMISTWHNTTITNCCILENNANILFENCNTNPNVIMTVKNCTLPSSDEFTTKGNVHIELTPSSSFLHGFVLTKDGIYCFGEPDSLEDLKPYIPTQKLRTCNGKRSSQFKSQPLISLFIIKYHS